MKNSKRQLELCLYLPKEVAEGAQNNPFTLTRLYKLRELGASIYIIEELGNEPNLVCMVDFEATLEMTETHCNMLSSRKDERKLIAYQKQFESINQSQPEFLQEQDDINLSFRVENSIVTKGSSTNIHWRSENAAMVEIDNVGGVPLVGSKPVTFFDHTILKIKASNNKQVKIKALYVNAVKQLNIKYTVKFFNPISKQFVSLEENKNNPGIFGVAKGSRIKLTWNIIEAEEVTILPFGMNQTLGEHIFQTNGSQEITIQAKLQEKVTSCRIIIHEFPMPVFTHNFIPIKKVLPSNIDLNIKDLRHQAVSFLESKGYLNNDKVRAELFDKISSQKNKLHDYYKELGFQYFYKKHSVPKLNRKIKERLKSYFKDEPSVLSMINTLRDYHEL
ncbi:MAG: hypothetical protein RIG77_20250 [Cyclobacteriaceae bacterium]